MKEKKGEDLVEAIEGEGEELRDIGLLRDRGKGKEAADSWHLLRRIIGLHYSELRND